MYIRFGKNPDLIDFILNIFSFFDSIFSCECRFRSGSDVHLHLCCQHLQLRSSCGRDYTFSSKDLSQFLASLMVCTILCEQTSILCFKRVTTSANHARLQHLPHIHSKYLFLSRHPWFFGDYPPSGHLNIQQLRDKILAVSMMKFQLHIANQTTKDLGN